MAGKTLSWIRVDCSTPDHPKVRRLERLLGDAALAYLVRLWAWTATYAPDGDLSGFEVAEIEAAARWGGEAGALADALVACGFLEDDPEGARLHGWQERQAEASRRRTAGAERSRRFRRRNAEAVTPVTLDPQERNAGSVTPVTPLRNAGTVTPTYERTNERTNSRESRGAGARDAEPPEPDLLPYLEELRERHPRFGLEFDVARALHRHQASLPPLAEFVAALEAHAGSDEWRDGYAPAATRWIDGGGWKSPPPAAKRRGSELGPKPVVAPPPELDVAGRLLALNERVRAAVGPVAELATLCERQSEAQPDPPEFVEEVLAKIDRALLANLEAGLAEDDREALLAGVSRAAKRLAQRVGGEEAARVVDRLRREAVRERFGLPVLSLFAPTPGAEEAA